MLPIPSARSTSRAEAVAATSISTVKGWRAVRRRRVTEVYRRNVTAEAVLCEDAADARVLN